MSLCLFKKGVTDAGNNNILISPDCIIYKFTSLHFY